MISMAKRQADAFKQRQACGERAQRSTPASFSVAVSGVLTFCVVNLQFTKASTHLFDRPYRSVGLMELLDTPCRLSSHKLNLALTNDSKQIAVLRMVVVSYAPPMPCLGLWEPVSN